MKTPKCSKCGQAMDEGYILDNTHGARLQSHWVEGQPQHSFWTGVTIRGRAKLP